MLNFKVTKRTNTGLRWHGTATLTPTPNGWQLTEEGQWGHLPGLSRQSLTWDGHTLTVGEGPTQHAYTCSTRPNGSICGTYLCGPDTYGFRSRFPLSSGPQVLHWWVNTNTPHLKKSPKQWRLIAKYIAIS